MNCREAESHIYLYRELSPREREETEKHVTTCAGCAQLLEAVRAQSNMIRAASQVEPEIPDASRMTRNIMESVHKRERRNRGVFNMIFPMSSANVLRYSMAMVSLLLVVTFVTEYNTGTQIARPQKAVPVQRNIELNSTRFHAMFIEKRETMRNTGTLFHECIMNCLYGPADNCEACRKQIAKL